jgi:hypothetical protein
MLILRVYKFGLSSYFHYTSVSMERERVEKIRINPRKIFKQLNMQMRSSYKVGSPFYDFVSRLLSPYL